MTCRYANFENMTCSINGEGAEVNGVCVCMEHINPIACCIDYTPSEEVIEDIEYSDYEPDEEDLLLFDKTNSEEL
jgi:hypothetical protein